LKTERQNIYFCQSFIEKEREEQKMSSIFKTSAVTEKERQFRGA